MNNVVLQRCLIYMCTHFLKLKIFFSFCCLLITIFIIFILDYKERTRTLLFNNLKHGGLYEWKIKSLC